MFITKVAPDGPAGKLGVLQVGDKIIKVDNIQIYYFVLSTFPLRAAQYFC